MNLTDALKQMHVQGNRLSSNTGECKACRYVATMTDEERAQITYCVEELGFGAPRLARAFRVAGYPIGDSTIGRHIAESH